MGDNLEHPQVKTVSKRSPSHFYPTIVDHFSWVFAIWNHQYHGRHLEHLLTEKCLVLRQSGDGYVLFGMPDPAQPDFQAKRVPKVSMHLTLGEVSFNF